MPAVSSMQPKEQGVARASRSIVCSLLILLPVFGFIATFTPADATSQSVPALIQARRIDINSASAGELELLPRIGPALAGRILEDRQEHGSFASVEALQRVRGIGPKTIESLRSIAIVSPTFVESPRDPSAVEEE